MRAIATAALFRGNRRILGWVGRIFGRDCSEEVSLNGLLLYLSEIGLNYLPKFWILNLR